MLVKAICTFCYNLITSREENNALDIALIKLQQIAAVRNPAGALYLQVLTNRLKNFVTRATVPTLLFLLIVSRFMTNFQNAKNIYN